MAEAKRVAKALVEGEEINEVTAVWAVMSEADEVPEKVEARENTGARWPVRTQYR